MLIRFSELSWPEAQDLLRKPTVILIPMGSTEQHGFHLPLNVDSACATFFAERAAEKVNEASSVRTLVAPTMHYSDVGTFSTFPGTVGISLQTEIALVGDIARSFLRQGFKNLLFLNGHAPNSLPISAALQLVSAEFPEAGLFALNWWALGVDTIARVRKSRAGLHADELETSLCLLIQPQNVAIEKAVAEMPRYALSEKWVKPDFYASNKLFFHSRKKYPRPETGHGVMGDPTVASRETGAQIATAVVDDLAQIILEIAQSEANVTPGLQE